MNNYAQSSQYELHTYIGRENFSPLNFSFCGLQAKMKVRNTVRRADDNTEIAERKRNF